jgi:hypothetical protein
VSILLIMLVNSSQRGSGRPHFGQHGATARGSCIDCEGTATLRGSSARVICPMRVDGKRSTAARSSLRNPRRRRQRRSPRAGPSGTLTDARLTDRGEAQPGEVVAMCAFHENGPHVGFHFDDVDVASAAMRTMQFGRICRLSVGHNMHDVNAACKTRDLNTAMAEIIGSGFCGTDGVFPLSSPRQTVVLT